MRKRLYILFLALLTWVGSAFASDELSVANVTLEPGGEATLVINFNFTTDNFTGYQFDLVLPEGIVTVKDEGGSPSFELGEGVYYKSHTVSASHLSSCDRFVCLSTSSQIFKVMSGVLLAIPISTDASLTSGTHEGKIKNIQFGTKDGRTLYLDEATFSITVNSQGGETPSGDRLVVGNAVASPGGFVNLDIQFEFETDNFTGYQFDLVLPESVNVVMDEEDAPSFELGEGVYYKSHNVSASHLSSCDRFVCLSTSSQIFKKMNGLLLTIPVSVAASSSGVLQGMLKNIQFGTQDGRTIYFDNVPFTITIGDGVIIGDVNKDGAVTIADVTALINILGGKDDGAIQKYDHDAADVNLDENVTIDDVPELVNIILNEQP